jgi:hypothetical protein
MYNDMTLEFSFKILQQIKKKRGKDEENVTKILMLLWKSDGYINYIIYAILPHFDCV